MTVCFSTIVGGGSLSLPFAFKNSGWVLGLIISFLSVQISLFSLQILCLLARKLGVNNCSEIMELTIGPGYATITNSLVAFILIFVIIAFLILMKDISGEIIEYFIPSMIVEANTKSLVLLVLVALISPLMIAESLHSLRHISYVGTSSVVVLLGVITVKAIQKNIQDPSVSLQARAWPEEPSGVLTALPIILISFFCQFNILGVYSGLSSPSPSRLTTVLNFSIYGSSFLYCMFGVAGYFVAFSSTEDNILKNFSPHDPSLIVARCGLLVTLLCQTPMVVVPCRQSLRSLLGLCLSMRPPPSSPPHSSRTQDIHAGDIEISVQSHPLLSLQAATQSLPPPTSTRSTNHSSSSSERQSLLHTSPPSTSDQTIPSFNQKHSPLPPPPDNLPSPTLIAFVLISFCLFFSECVPGVSTIWTLAGSSVSLVLAFLLPSWAYICFYNKRISSQFPSSQDLWNLRCAWGLLALSLLMIVLCTSQSIRKIFTS